jgi:hypothetical protein
MNIAFLILLGILRGYAVSDDPVYYARVTNTWSYLSNDRITVTEYWFTKDKLCSVTTNSKTIIRKDKGVRHLVNLRTGSVLTRPLQQATATTDNEKKDDFKYAGQNYSPVYEWNEPLLISKEKCAGYNCDHFLSKGDADFDRISVEFLMTEAEEQWIADNINSFMLNSPKREPLSGMVKSNGKLFPVKIIEDVENAIAPHIVTTLVIDKLEKVTPSEDLFEPPATNN